MASPEGSLEPLTTWGQAFAAIGIGAVWLLSWLYRFMAGRKEPPPQHSMSIEQAFSTPTDDLQRHAERCADALEDIHALMKTLISEQEKAKEAEKAAAIQSRLDAAESDRRELMAMIENLRADITRQDRRAKRGDDLT